MSTNVRISFIILYPVLEVRLPTGAEFGITPVKAPVPVSSIVYGAYCT
jgi:hypothetical protein